MQLTALELQRASVTRTAMTSILTVTLRATEKGKQVYRECSPACEACYVVPQERHTDSDEQRVGYNAQQAEVAPLKKQVCKGCTPQHYTALDRIPPQKDLLHCTKQQVQISEKHITDYAL